LKVSTTLLSTNDYYISKRYIFCINFDKIVVVIKKSIDLKYNKENPTSIQCMKNYINEDTPQYCTLQLGFEVYLFQIINDDKTHKLRIDAEHFFALFENI